MEHALGAIFSGIDVRDYQMVCTATNYEFPKEFELETPCIKCQNEVGSCVAHAMSSIMEYFNHKQNGDDTEMSTGYIYGNRTNSEHKGSGMIMRDAIEIAMNFGDVPHYEFPENIEVPYAINLYEQRADKLYESGRPHRITEYCRINTVAAAKLSLLAGMPLLMAMEWYADMHLEDGVMVTNYIGYEGGHCMFIYGWDERGWLVQNSWGEDWGENGRFVLPYEMGMAECWALIDDIVEGAIIKKPFSSKAGKFFAKIINKVCNVFKK